MTPRTIAHQTPLSIGFSRQECWNGVPCPPPGDLPEPGIELASLTSPVLVGGFLKAQLVKDSCNAGDLGSIPGVGRSSGEGKGTFPSSTV